MCRNRGANSFTPERKTQHRENESVLCIQWSFRICTIKNNMVHLINFFSNTRFMYFRDDEMEDDDDIGRIEEIT